MATVPEDAQNVIESFRVAEKAENYSKKIDLFETALELSKEVLVEFPSFEEKIKTLKRSYTRSLLKSLKNTGPDLDQITAIRYILLFVTTVKEETKSIIQDDFSLKESLVEFTSLWSENAEPELRSIISTELGF